MHLLNACSLFLDQDQSCDDCISTRVCIIAARTYLTFTLLFNQSLIHSECELLLNGHPSQTITEQSCVDVQDVSSNNYSIQCPICQQGDQNINHVIRNSNFTNCSDSGKHIILINFGIYVTNSINLALGFETITDTYNIICAYVYTYMPCAYVYTYHLSTIVYVRIY